jgi:hypothetical protein
VSKTAMNLALETPTALNSPKHTVSAADRVSRCLSIKGATGRMAVAMKPASREMEEGSRLVLWRMPFVINDITISITNRLYALPRTAPSGELVLAHLTPQ